MKAVRWFCAERWIGADDNCDSGEEAMSFIEKEGANPGYWECDYCGQCALLGWDFMSEWTRLKAEGWQATKVEGHWMHTCDECSAQARKSVGEEEG